jgi:hypothetical protein
MSFKLDQISSAAENFPASEDGWHKLMEGYPWFDREGQYPIPAYSEFMPPPRLGRTPYGGINTSLFTENDLYGWQISELEEEYELKPGLDHIARQVMEQLLKLGQGQPAYLIAGHQGQNLLSNPYWPPELAARVGRLAHERYVALLPLALSRTQDDKGRVRWTFFGGSEQGPELAFWKGFYSAPGQELPPEQAFSFFRHLLSSVYGESISDSAGLATAGFRILPTRSEDDLPSWSLSYRVNDQAAWEGIRYLLTFRPFSLLPTGVQERYLAGSLALLPFPGSLVFWGMPTYLRLSKQLPQAMQIPLQRLVERHNGLDSLRVPQSGWLLEPHPNLKPSEFQKELLKHTYTRTHRWDRINRNEDELALNPRVEKVARVLFSTALDVIGLYDKPMARNCQIWTKAFELLLDGPNASPVELQKAEKALVEGGLFGYRFQFPAMQVGRFDVYWQRPLVAYASPQTGEIHRITEAPLGYLTAYPVGKIELEHPVELWPRLSRQEIYNSALHDFNSSHDKYAHQTSLNLLTLLDIWRMMEKQQLPRSFTRSLLRIAKHESLEGWRDSLSDRTADQAIANRMKAAVANLLNPANSSPSLPSGITYGNTATRTFEEAFWNDILYLAHGQYLNKDNADCIRDAVTMQHLTHFQRDLESLGDYLIKRHRQAIVEAGMEGEAVCNELPFQWQTDFDFSLFGGWMNDQEGNGYERNILVVIPGKNRKEAVVMADHYDTAYMEDLYDKNRGGNGARLAAAGADDNCSATTTLLQAAPIFLKLAKEGRLERDIWLLHLTGEEFPSDCMGARYFCQSLVEKTLKLRLEQDQPLDLSGVKIVGTFVLDMIAHNRGSDLDIFQISPGKSSQSIWLAWQAHLANMTWNVHAKEWNTTAERRGHGRGKRSQDGHTIPEIAAHLQLDGEVRTMDDPQSSLFNTDGQIFSDIGAPVVLFMENYDINRSGYHDTRDTMVNIDLDYGAALAAITIETVARVAMVTLSSENPSFLATIQ